jgi:COMPASS component SPP1
MRARIMRWTGTGGDREKLWESVKHAERREGVVLHVRGCAPAPIPARPVATKAERALARLRVQLDGAVARRAEFVNRMDALVWRERVTALAVRRAEGVEDCGWDQRLCFGDEDIAEFGAGVLESYGEGDPKAEGSEAEPDAMQVEEAEEAEWWCAGKKKCERHVGCAFCLVFGTAHGLTVVLCRWQKLRVAEIDFAKEMLELALEKLTSHERDIRKRVEDIVDPHAHAPATTNGALVSPVTTVPVAGRNAKHLANGASSSGSKPTANGEAKKSKKKG